MIIPKLINYNHRFRGPIESYKENEMNSSIENSLKELREIIDFNESMMQSIKQKTSNESRSELYNELFIASTVVSELGEEIYG